MVIILRFDTIKLCVNIYHGKVRVMVEMCKETLVFMVYVCCFVRQLCLFIFIEFISDEIFVKDLCLMTLAVIQ